MGPWCILFQLHSNVKILLYLPHSYSVCCAQTRTCTCVLALSFRKHLEINPGRWQDRAISHVHIQGIQLNAVYHKANNKIISICYHCLLVFAIIASQDGRSDVFKPKLEQRREQIDGWWWWWSVSRRRDWWIKMMTADQVMMKYQKFDSLNLLRIYECRLFLSLFFSLPFSFHRYTLCINYCFREYYNWKRKKKKGTINFNRMKRI